MISRRLLLAASSSAPVWPQPPGKAIADQATWRGILHLYGTDLDRLDARAEGRRARQVIEVGTGAGALGFVPRLDLRIVSGLEPVVIVDDADAVVRVGHRDPWRAELCCGCGRDGAEEGSHGDRVPCAFHAADRIGHRE